MITYELAKQLKEAGFPFNKLHSENTDWCYGNDCTDVHQPTISELIEACGDRFKKLWRHSNGKWTATVGTKTEKDTLSSKEIDGCNPEEAVANLWLIINKK